MWISPCCRNGDELFATANGEAGRQVKLPKCPEFDTWLLLVTIIGHQGEPTTHNFLFSSVLLSIFAKVPVFKSFVFILDTGGAALLYYL